MPPDGAPDRKGAGIVISHPMSGVKEQTAGAHALKLAKSRFIAFTFDAAYQGESSGEPRGYENPYQRVEDIKAAVTYLTTLPKIDPERLGALGICASGGYILNTAQGDVRIKAVAIVSAGDTGRMIREASKPKAVITRSLLLETLRGSTKARMEEAKGSQPQLLNLLPTNPADVSYAMPDFMKEGSQYYKTDRGIGPRSNGKWPFRSNGLLVNYDSFASNNLISPRPSLMIMGSDADTAYFSADAIKLSVIQGKTHIALYDHLTESVPKLVDFYAKALS